MERALSIEGPPGRPASKRTSPRTGSATPTPPTPPTPSTGAHPPTSYSRRLATRAWPPPAATPTRGRMTPRGSISGCNPPSRRGNPLVSPGPSTPYHRAAGRRWGGRYFPRYVAGDYARQEKSQNGPTDALRDAGGWRVGCRGCGLPWEVRCRGR